MAELNAWHRFFSRFIRRLYFERITVIDADGLPRQGPALYVGLHRNGAVDGLVYQEALPRAVFLISSQLRRSRLGRLFFSGIAVTRPQDAAPGSAPADNAGALRACLEHLAAGGELCVFPEGTSSLGPRHLPFKSGAARLCLSARERRIPLFLVPVAVFYQEPTAFRASVEVVIGDPIDAEAPPGSPLSRLREVKRRIAEGLEALGTNVADAEVQEDIQRLASAAAIGARRSYWRSLKALERGIPPETRDVWQRLEPELARPGLRLEQGLPPFPEAGLLLPALGLALSAPLVLGAIALNLPPYAAAWWAGRRFPDGRNVVSLWKILVGVPAFLLWAALLTAAALAACPWAALGYAVLTGAGLWLYSRTRRLAKAVNNGLRHPDLAPALHSLRRALQEELRDA